MPLLMSDSCLTEQIGEVTAIAGVESGHLMRRVNAFAWHSRERTANSRESCA
jgi:hypothetical protein